MTPTRQSDILVPAGKSEANIRSKEEELFYFISGKWFLRNESRTYVDIIQLLYLFSNCVVYILSNTVWSKHSAQLT